MIDADDIDNILTGQLANLPPLQPTTVKIFICANREEFDVERKYLWLEVLPDLQQHCLQYGVDILFKDMLLGNHSEYPRTTEEYEDWIREVEHCHKESVGPFFLSLLGNQYGDVSIPDTVDKNEFEQLVSVAMQHNMDIDLLVKWYKLDENAIPAHYALKPCGESRTKIYEELLATIQKLSTKKTTNGDEREEYFVSGVERQIKQALWLNAQNSVFVFRSYAKNTNQHNGTDNGVHKSVEQHKLRNDDVRLKRLRENIVNKTDESNILHIEKPATEHTPATNKTMEGYIDNFISVVVRKLAQVIDRGVSKYKSFSSVPRESFDYKDTLYHLHQCLHISKESSKVAYEKYVSKVQAHLINGSRSEHQLCIIKGSEGCGKSSILAKSCLRARKLFGPEAIIIPIFVGLTEKSLLAADVFRIICWQINLVLKQEIDIETYTLKKLLSYFHGLMNRVSKSHHQLLIFLDGIEKMQLHQNQNHNVHSFDAIDWLATRLPAKFHIIVTCSSTENSTIVKRLESKLLNNDVIMYVNNMSEEDCSIVLDRTLLQCRRKLTDEQQKAVTKSFTTERHPLIVFYNSNRVTQWQSHFTSSDGDDALELHDHLPKTVERLILEILTKLECAVNTTIATHVCTYLALARYGLTEVELCDVLTANDEVILEGHENIKPDVIRFPSVLLAKILDILRPILSQRYVGGKTLLTWSNKRCFNAIRQRYLASPEKSLLAHKDLANIFLENWNTKDPFDPSKEYDVLAEETDRVLCPQPLVYNDIMYNKRKLHELWFHLLKSGDIDRFKEHTFCNFEYLLAMADSDNVQKVGYNLDLVKSSLVDEDIHVLDLALKSAGVALRTSPLQLANELIGRMRQIKGIGNAGQQPDELFIGYFYYFQRYIEPLVMQCMEWCDNYTLPLLVPLTTWLDNVHIPLVTSMTHDHVISSAALMPNGQHVIIATDTSISMYHLATSLHVKSFIGHSAAVTCLHLDPMSRVLISGSKDKTICAWNIDTEECLHTFRDFKTYVTCLACLDNALVICGTDDGSVVVRNLESGDVVKTLVTHRKRVTAMQLCKSKSILITSSLDSKLILWYTAEWSIMNVIDVDVLTPILAIDVSIDSTFLVAGCDNGSLHVIAMATGTIAQTLTSHAGNIRSVRICKDCHHCVAASTTGEVYLYNFRATEVLDVYKKHKSDVMSVMTSENEQLAVSVSKNEVCVWSLLKRYTRETYNDAHSGAVSCIKLTADAKKVVSGSLDGFLKTWNLDISDFADNFVGHTGPVTCLDIANDNSFVVSGSSDMTLKVWNMTRVSIITNYKGHDQVVSGVHVLSDNRLVLSLDGSQKIHMWRAEDGQNMRLYAGPTALHAVAPNSQHCISGAGDNRLQIWKLSDGSVTKEVSHTDKITCLQCSKDSQFLVTGSLDRSVKVWEIDSGKIVQIIVEHSTSVRCLNMTSDNETIIAAGDDGVIHVCSLNLGSIERKLTGHVDKVTCLDLTADDTVLISGCLDHTVRVWNHRRGTQLTLFDAHYPVVDMVLTDLADRIALQLANNNHVPILCLHNSPARPKPTPRVPTEVTLSVASVRAGSLHGTCFSSTGSRVDLSDFNSEEERTLPIKPRPCTRPRVPATIALPPKRRRESSVSSIPQIIQYSPMKAPVQATVQAQEKRRLKFPLPINMNKPKNKSENVDTKRSHICAIL